MVPLVNVVIELQPRVLCRVEKEEDAGCLMQEMLLWLLRTSTIVRSTRLLLLLLLMRVLNANADSAAGMMQADQMVDLFLY